MILTPRGSSCICVLECFSELALCQCTPGTPWWWLQVMGLCHPHERPTLLDRILAIAASREGGNPYSFYLSAFEIQWKIFVFRWKRKESRQVHLSCGSWAKLSLVQVPTIATCEPRDLGQVTQHFCASVCLSIKCWGSTCCVSLVARPGEGHAGSCPLAGQRASLSHRRARGHLDHARHDGSSSPLPVWAETTVGRNPVERFQIFPFLDSLGGRSPRLRVGWRVLVFNPNSYHQAWTFGPFPSPPRMETHGSSL